jgi:hypothetical protein
MQVTSDLLPLDESDPAVRLKLEMLERVIPASHAVVFGDMWGVEGAYTQRLRRLGVPRATQIDAFESPGWLRARLADSQLNFLKGDFSDAMFMASIREQYEIGVAFDVLLHQGPLISTLHLMLSKLTSRIVIVQPMLRERELPGSLVYLPGNHAARELAPVAPDDPIRPMSAVNEVNPAHWIWAMTPSFLKAALAGEGFTVTLERQHEEGFPNTNWNWWGCIAQRAEYNLVHWSRHTRYHDVRDPT